MSFRRIALSILSFIPAGVCYGFITFLSNQPQLPGPGDDGIRDFVWFKSGHVTAYTLLLLCLFFGIRFSMMIWSKRKSIKVQSFLALSILLVLAILDEIHQSFIPGRTPRATDVMIDLFGSGTVLFILQRYNAFLPRGRKKKAGM